LPLVIPILRRSGASCRILVAFLGDEDGTKVSAVVVHRRYGQAALLLALSSV
jgi:hypothetical protein